jgi:hypothetical protein
MKRAKTKLKLRWLRDRKGRRVGLVIPSRPAE